MTPNGTIYVCKDTNLIMNGSDFDTIYFDTTQHKLDWFMSKVIKTLMNRCIHAWVVQHREER